MGHDDSVNLRVAIQPCLSVELLKIHFRIFEHFERQPQRFDGMLINAHRNDQRIGRYPR